MAYADTGLENWVLSYMVSNDLRKSWTALLSKASMDREEQGTMERVFLLPHLRCGLKTDGGNE